jgi:phosphohistidine phosphatase
MTLSLYLLRHAKAEEHSDRGDHERVLKRRGRKAAHRVGRLLAGLDQRPELVLCSTAARARETAEVALDAWGEDVPMQRLAAIYAAGPETLLEQVQSVAPGTRSVLMVGHQPGLGLLIKLLTGAEPDFPTAALARIEIPVATWTDVQRGTGHLALLVTPEILGVLREDQ